MKSERRNGENGTVLVTGGAGFIGSHLAGALLREGHAVAVIDNLSSGRNVFIPEKAKFIQKNLVTDPVESDLQGIETVFHFAADPDVRASVDPQSSFNNNLVATFRLLEACRKADVKRIVFASTSAVYGEAKQLPTPEEYPALPVSNYGASKLACEAYCASYAASYGMRVSVLRFANIFGEHSTHGVMHDFYRKLRQNPQRLEILGNGKQAKSYLHVSDALAATLRVWKKQRVPFDVFNVGSGKTITVNEIARKMCGQLSVSPKFVYAGGDRGWVGDVPSMLLDTQKLRKLGWKEEIQFDEGLHRYVRWMQTFYSSNK